MQCSLDLEYPSAIGEEQICENEGSYDAKDIAPRNWNLNSSYLYSSGKEQHFLTLVSYSVYGIYKLVLLSIKILKYSTIFTILSLFMSNVYAVTSALTSMISICIHPQGQSQFRGLLLKCVVDL